MIHRARYIVTGTVQGVGFRPFVYRAAAELSLAGFVQNSPDGVVIEAEGSREALREFKYRLAQSHPPLCRIHTIYEHGIPPLHETSFSIVQSTDAGYGTVDITPDSATCSMCVSELFDPHNRRYLYPFINCTDCGPRLTIVSDIPYDRKNTTMSCFPLCEECSEEYTNPADRRFHAEPNACPACGPSLMLYDNGGRRVQPSDIFQYLCNSIKDGKIIALKGIGGFHLCADATQEDAVARLRQRKSREEKPLAIMVKDADAAGRIAVLGPDELDMLESPQRPIMLLKKYAGSPIAPSVAPGVGDMGIMLPYTPIHHILFFYGSPPLVMTSANRSDEPICVGNREAISRLSGIADFFLVHNRDIRVRCDDSIVVHAAGLPRVQRRARGFVPTPIQLSRSLPDVLALGPHLKSTLCIVTENKAFLSPHIGDMNTPEARDFFHQSIEIMQKISRSRPSIVACDMHPDYYATRVAGQMRMCRVIHVQHHHAHIVSCMAENSITGTVIGIALDGTGYGTDGSVWGGELLVADEEAAKRAGHVSSFFMPGGARAVYEPWRSAAGLLRKAFGDSWGAVAESIGLLPDSMRPEIIDRMAERQINCVKTSSMGRVFDGVAVLLGIRARVSFEGQAAMELEACAAGRSEYCLPFAVTTDNDMIGIDYSPAVRSAVEMSQKGVPRGDISRAFHDAAARSWAEAASLLSRRTGIERVVLSGGCFQNRILLEHMVAELAGRGLKPFAHAHVPANDGGISLGQAVCAAAIVKAEGD